LFNWIWLWICKCHLTLYLMWISDFINVCCQLLKMCQKVYVAHTRTPIGCSKHHTRRHKHSGCNFENWWLRSWHKIWAKLSLMPMLHAKKFIDRVKLILMYNELKYGYLVTLK
jgi:hypothetical protein